MNSFVKQLGEPGALENIIQGEMELSDLPAFLRVLLTTDGTVTNSLEAYFWEPVAVEPISQAITPLVEDAPSIDKLSGEHVLSRHVQLHGKKSGRVFVEAKSLVNIELLSDSFREDLQAGKMGIGELLRDCGLETYREILEIGYDDQVREVWRTYRIVMEHRPFIQITEHFPLAVYSL